MDTSYVVGLEGWIEKLSAKNKSLEKKITTLKNKSPNALNHLEEENSKLKQKIKSLKLLRKENNKLIEENESLKLENSKLKKGPEIIEVSSDSEDKDNKQGVSDSPPSPPNAENRKSERKHKPSAKAKESSPLPKKKSRQTKLCGTCRQPRNNRFMIWCDRCDDWFHGNCVGVTGKMKVEENSIWKCPPCKKTLKKSVE